MNTLVAIPIVAAVPTSAPARPSEVKHSADPIFAAIFKYREAEKKSQKAYARVSTLYKQAAKQGLDEDSPLEDRNAFVEKRLGCDPDEFTDGPAVAHWDAADDVFSIAPTSHAGIIAMLRFANALNESDRDLVAENVENLVSSLTQAAEALLQA